MGGEWGPDWDGGSGSPGEETCLSPADDDGASLTSGPSPLSNPFAGGTAARFAILGDSEPEPTEGEGVDLSKF